MHRVRRIDYLFVTLVFLLAHFTFTANSLAQVMIEGHAPVPEVVAISRPAESEVKIAEEALNKFLEKEQGQGPVLLQYYHGVL